MLSAGRLLKKLNLSKDVLTSVRLLSLGLNENIRDNNLKDNLRNNIQRNLTETTQLRDYRKPGKKFKNVVELLENNTRRHGRIDPKIFKKCLQNLPNENLTSKEWLILLKCCGPLMFNLSKENRNKYTNEIWKLIKEKEISIDIMHYNLLIKTYIENEFKFDPLKLLDEIKENNLKPNLRTYEFIIYKYCLDGNLDNVTKILEKMNEENLSLTASMFDSLILGHFKNKDIKTANETYELMKESNIEITNSTYKNLIIGQLYNYNSNTINSIIELINNERIRFEINDITDILDELKKLKLNENELIKLKELLINNIKRNDNFYNDLSNCCYRLILIKEYDIVEKLFNLNFIDDQTRDYFIKRLITSILKSDELNKLDYCRFLKKILPTFNFTYSVKGTLQNSDFNIDDILRLIDELKPILDIKDNGILCNFIDKCETSQQLHLLTEYYLTGLDNNWINHIKKHFLPFLNVDLFKFMEEYSLKNQNQNSVNLLAQSIFCYYLDNLKMDELNKFYKQFRPEIKQLSNNYLLERTEQLLKSNADNFKLLFNAIVDKLKINHTFKNSFFELCINYLNDDQLKELIYLFDNNGLKILINKLNDQQLNKLNEITRQPISTNFNSKIKELRKNLVNNKSIKIDDDLIELKNYLKSSNQMYSIFLDCLDHLNYELANFFYEPNLKLHKPTILKFLNLKLKNNENKNEAINFIEQHLNDYQNEIINSESLQIIIDEIFDKIKDDGKLVFSFINRISKILKPIDLLEHLIYFFEQTQNQEIGQQLIKLNVFLLNNDQNKIFRTMCAFILNRNTNLLQELSDAIIKSKSIKYSKNRVYEELAIAFIYSKRFKQAIKVIETDDFKFNKLRDIFSYLLKNDKEEVIKQYSILVYQNSSKSRTVLLDFLQDFLNFKGKNQLFEDILAEIKKLSLINDTNKDKTLESTNLLNNLIGRTKINEKQQDSNDSGKKENRDELLKLVDQILNKKKILKLNLECDIVDKLINLKELDKATDLIYDMLKNERYPIPATIKNLLKELNFNGKLNLIEKLEPYLPLPLKESEFYKSNKILTYLRTTNSENEIMNCLDNLNVFTSDLIDQIFTIKPNYEEQLIKLLKEKKKSNLHYVWIHYMKNSKFDKALELVNKNPELNGDKLLYQPIINLAKQNNNLELAKQLLDYINRFELKSNTIESIFNCYIKLCLTNNKIEEAKQKIREIQSKEIRKSVLNLDSNLINKLDQSFIDEFIKE